MRIYIMIIQKLCYIFSIICCSFLFSYPYNVNSFPIERRLNSLIFLCWSLVQMMDKHWFSPSVSVSCNFFWVNKSLDRLDTDTPTKIRALPLDKLNAYKCTYRSHTTEVFYVSSGKWTCDLLWVHVVT